MTKIVISFAVLALAACGDDGGNPPAADSAPPAADAGAPDAAPIPFLTEVTCTNPGPPGTGIGAGTTLHKVTLDAYPDAVCNDGTPAIMYVRASSGGMDANRWLFHLQGGGSCDLDYQRCVDRWCSADNGAGQQRSKMTSMYAPEAMPDKGIWLRDPVNLLGGANDVFIYYCSSDGWSGSASDVVVTNPDDPAQQFRAHYRGHDIVVAAFDALRAGAVVSDDGVETMPDLDDATDVLITGTSAGASGVTYNGDFLAGEFDPAAVNVWLLFDATLRADSADITDPAVAAALDQAQMDAFTRDTAMNRFLDQSCAAAHPGADAWLCNTSTHVRLNHITTAFYQRMDLIDPTSIPPGLTAMQVGPWNQATALRVPSIQAEGEEGAQVPRAPAIYAPLCAQHVGITNTAYTHMATLEDAMGTPWTVHDSLIQFLAGNDVALVDDGMPPPASTCPPTDGAFD